MISSTILHNTHNELFHCVNYNELCSHNVDWLIGFVVKILVAHSYSLLLLKKNNSNHTNIHVTCVQHKYLSIHKN